MAKNRGQATVSSRLVDLANMLKSADGEKMDSQLECNKSLFLSLECTFTNNPSTTFVLIFLLSLCE